MNNDNKQVEPYLAVMGFMLGEDNPAFIQGARAKLVDVYGQTYAFVSDTALHKFKTTHGMSIVNLEQMRIARTSVGVDPDIPTDPNPIPTDFLDLDSEE